MVIWTPGSVDSRWVRGEARDAADRGVLVPVRFQNAKLPIDFRAVHTIDLDQWGGDAKSPAFRSLCRALEGKLGAPKAAASVQSAAKRPVVGICVLPFANMSGDPEQEYFSDGITEDIITDLSKVSALSIVSRNTAFSFKGKNLEMAQVARQTKATHVLDLMIDSAAERKQFDQPIANFQLGQQLIADSVIEVNAARLMMLNAASMIDRGRDARDWIAMVKVQASETLGRVVDRAVQVFGGMGFCKDLPIEKYYRDARIYRIFDGTSEIHRTVIARSAVRHRAALYDVDA